MITLLDAENIENRTTTSSPLPPIIEVKSRKRIRGGEWGDDDGQTNEIVELRFLRDQSTRAAKCKISSQH